MKKDISSREEGVTKDMQPAKARERDFRFPKLGVTVKAKSLSEALKKAKAIKQN